jgi:hypothetical protein
MKLKIHARDSAIQSSLSSQLLSLWFVNDKKWPDTLHRERTNAPHLLKLIDRDQRTMLTSPGHNGPRRLLANPWQHGIFYPIGSVGLDLVAHNRVLMTQLTQASMPTIREHDSRGHADHSQHAQDGNCAAIRSFNPLLHLTIPYPTRAYRLDTTLFASQHNWITMNHRPQLAGPQSP